MRIVTLAVGSRGDVAPYVGLGVRLQQAGHEVAIATHTHFETMVVEAGLGFAALPLDTREELMAKAGSGSLTGIVAVNRSVGAQALPLGRAMAAAAQGADVLLLTPAGWIGGHVAEGLKLPSLGVYLQPMTPTREFPPSTVTTRSLGAWGNRAAARAVLEWGQQPYKKGVRALRAELGLPPIGHRQWLRDLDASGWPICYGYSPHVVPQPADWPSSCTTVGYWWPAPAPDFTPPAELAAFLEAGPPPVYVGFGSMPSRDARALSALVRDAARAAGVRAVVSAGWAGLETSGDDALTISEVPHEWLFPRMAAVVHHAGAGTTAAGLRAGVPAVPVPLMVDQPFWAQHLVRLGVAPTTIPFRRLTATRLGAAIRTAVEDPSYRQRAGEMAAILSAEDGAAGVLHALDNLN
ncbi:glycosyltransferase [Actinoplanes sp. TRM 88003]|uniref:Glycosyltransferase n=1 Tax=Paractinoplanes aksuensis TaxID=2939490 RepID=A0ABT1E1C2_9ACTN|nr:glycosyltransferase [Actinoplanes aksuensis]MCO8276939.1 glycosyltransferase [Actinoplanes aksuensis]